MDIYDFAETIKTKQDFDKFLILLHEEFLKEGANWENNTLERFLEALSAFSPDVQQVYINWDVDIDTNKPDWKVMAKILLAAIVYE